MLRGTEGKAKGNHGDELRSESHFGIWCNWQHYGFWYRHSRFESWYPSSEIPLYCSGKSEFHIAWTIWKRAESVKYSFSLFAGNGDEKVQGPIV